MELRALQPAPPTPMTLIFAKRFTSGLINIENHSLRAGRGRIQLNYIGCQR